MERENLLSSEASLRTNLAISNSLPIRFVDKGGKRTIIEDIQQVLSAYDEDNLDNNINEVFEQINTIIADNYNGLLLLDIVYAIYQAGVNINWSNIGAFLAYEYLLGEVEAAQDQGIDLASGLSNNLPSPDDDLGIKVEYIDSLAEERATLYVQEVNAIKNSYSKVRNYQDTYNAVTPLKIVARRNIAVSSHYNVTYNGFTLDRSMAGYVYNTLQLNKFVRVVAWGSKVRVWNDENIDEYSQYYVHDKPDVVTIMIFNNSASVRAKIYVNYTTSTLRYSNRPTFNNKLIDAILIDLGFTLTTMQSGRKEDVYYETNVRYDNFTAVFGTLVLINPILSQILTLRDLENYNKGVINKKGFATTNEKCALRYIYPNGQMYNITVFYDTKAAIGRVVSTADEDYIVNLKFDKDTPDEVATYISKVMAKVFAYVIRIGLPIQSIFTSVGVSKSLTDKRSTNVNNTLRSLNTNHPELFDNNYVSRISPLDRLPLVGDKENEGDKFDLVDNDGKSYTFTCPQEYPVATPVPNPLASSYIFPNIYVCEYEQRQADIYSNVASADSYLDFDQRGEIPREIELFLKDTLSMDSLQRIGILRDRYTSLRRCVDYLIGKYNDFSYVEPGVEEFNESVDINSLDALQDLYNCNIYVINKQGKFIFAPQYAFPSFNPKLTMCCLVYCNTSESRGDNPLDDAIYEPIVGIKAEEDIYLFPYETNKAMYQLMLSCHTTLIVYNNKIYNNPFNRIGLEYFNSAIDSVYFDSNGKIRGVAIGNAKLEVPPFVSHYIKKFRSLGVSTPTSVVRLLGEPNNKVNIVYLDKEYTVYLYNFLGMPDMIKALLPREGNNAVKAWYDVFTIPILTPQESLVNRHIDIKLNAVIFLKLVYWCWQIENNMGQVLVVDNNVKQYVVDNIDFILPNLRTTNERIRYMRKAIGLIGDGPVPVSNYLYTTITNLMEFVLLTRKPLKRITIKEITYKYKQPEVIEFNNTGEIETYLTYSGVNSRVPLLTTYNETLFNSKPPFSYFDGNNLYAVSNEYPTKAKVTSNTVNETKVIGIDVIASVKK